MVSSDVIAAHPFFGPVISGGDALCRHPAVPASTIEHRAS